MNILVAIDFSGVTEDILTLVKKISGQEAEILLLHVIDPDPDFIGYEPGPKVERNHIAKKLKIERKQIELVAEKLRSEGYNTKALHLQGAIAETILKEAAKCESELIVMGSHGHGAVYNFIVGGVTESVLKHAPCPIVVVPAKTGG